ncbi:MAG: hypothetical protein RIG63_08135 [Coleofasciculus chthonoplastes F3-SA18-01]|uniref:hypothetical protein n=1 Tax=Coleofasciculus chthonoplastes TaxID=64178 RepID=UPI003300D076
MNKLLIMTLSISILLEALGGNSAGALTLRSWNSANQRGGDLFNDGNGALLYGAFRSSILERSHTILPGVSTLTEANLADVDIFFHGTSSTILTPTESTVLRNFVKTGGFVIVESDSNRSEQNSANSVLESLGLGSRYTGVVGGVNSPTGGMFKNIVSPTTVGALGDLRGQTFGTSLATDIESMVTDITPTGGTLIGTNGSIRSMVEFQPFADGGQVLAVGDPYGFNLFQSSDNSLFNHNNQKAYINFIESKQSEIPVPEASMLLGLLTLGTCAIGTKLSKK